MTSSPKRGHEKLVDGIRLTVWIPGELHAQAVKAAKADDRSLSNWVRRALAIATNDLRP